MKNRYPEMDEEWRNTPTQKKEFNRREFLKTVGILSLGGKVVGDILINQYNNYLENKIYNELPNHVYLANYSAVVGNDKETTSKGYGIILNQKYLSLAHIIDSLNQYCMNSPFGRVCTSIDAKNKKCKINDKELEILVTDTDNDIFIADAKNLGLPDFPAKPKKDIKYGEDIYMIGNPRLRGFNIRKTKVSDSDLFDGVNELIGGKYNLKDYFGVGKTVIPGDSGTPSVSKDFKLVGLNAIYFNGLGYIQRITSTINKYPDLLKK